MPRISPPSRSGTRRQKAGTNRDERKVDEAVAILNGDNRLPEFGKLLHESWLLKKSLTDLITTSKIDEIYEAARKAGALGGKLLGAGGGGFMLLFVPPERRIRVQKALKGLIHVPFRFENLGTQVILYSTQDFF